MPVVRKPVVRKPVAPVAPIAPPVLMPTAKPGPQYYRDPNAIETSRNTYELQTSNNPYENLQRSAQYDYSPDRVTAPPTPVPVTQFTPSPEWYTQTGGAAGAMPPPVIPAGPHSTAADQRNQTAMGGLKRIGESIQNNPLGAINTGLGVAGLAMYATAKRPGQLARPATLTSEIPVQSYEDDRARAQAAQAATMSTGQMGLQRQAGSDINSYIAGMQNLQGQQIGANADLNQKIMDLRRADATAAAAQRNEDTKYNLATQRSYDEAIYNEKVGRFNEQRAKGEKLAQSSLEYWNAKNTEDRQYAENIKKQKGEQAKLAFDAELRDLSTRYGTVPGLAQMTPEQQVEATKANNLAREAERTELYKRYGIVPGASPIEGIAKAPDLKRSVTQ